MALFPLGAGNLLGRFGQTPAVGPRGRFQDASSPFSKFTRPNVLPKINTRFRFFFDRAAVINALSKEERNYLVQVGAIVRKIARNSLKLGKYIPWKEIKDFNVGKAGYSNLWNAEGTRPDNLHRLRYRQRKQRRKMREIVNRGGPRSERERQYYERLGRISGRIVRPRKTSEPFQVPHITWRNSPLKKLLFFQFDPTRRSVVIGPEVASTRDAHTIEYGGTSNKSGVKMLPRPLMHIAFKKAKRAYTNLLKDMVK